MPNLKTKIHEIEKSNEEGLLKAEILSKREQEEICAQRKYEALKFEQFKKIIDGQRYFRIQHLKDLGIDYQIAIHLSAKNVGKTTELYRLIRACLERGKKFIYGRVNVDELDTELEKFSEDDISPVIMVKNQSRYYFFKKTDVNDFLADNEDAAVSYTSLIKYGATIVGKGMAFMKSNVLGSGNYADYEMLFFDEIVSYAPRETVNHKILFAWSCAISTILRNKKDLTVIMMGNLHNNKTDVPILRYYGIDVQDNLRVIKRSMGDGEPCTILYVNSGSLYNNALKNQASVAHHASLDDRLFMEHNKIINTNTKVLNRGVIADMQSIYACAMEFEEDIYALELRSYSSEDPMDRESFFALAVHPMTLTTSLKCDIYSHDSYVASKFQKIIYRKNMRPLFKSMYKLFTSKSLYYADSHSLEIGSRCLSEIVSLELDRTAPPMP